MRVADIRWTELHDATLESLELQWASGEAVLRIRTGDVACPRIVVVAASMRRLQCDRQLPWGFSGSINAVRGPASGHEGAALELEMQSGDVIRIEAGAFTMRAG